MGTRRAATVLAVIVLASGCAGSGHHETAAHASSPAIPPAMVHGWSPVSATPARHTHAVWCRLSTTPALVVRLRVPTDYRRSGDPAGPRACEWVAPDAVVAQIRVEISSRSLAAEAAKQRDPARNGQDAGTSQDGSHDVRLTRGRVFGQPHGELLSYGSDFENVPLRVSGARLAPLTLSMSVSADGHALYASADEDFARVMGSLAVG